MPSKFDLLREGKAIEIEPGLSAMLLPDQKKLKLSNGEVLDVSDDPDFYPPDEQALAYSKQKELVEKGIKGTGGEFLHKYSTQGIPGSIRDINAYFTQSGEEYLNNKRAEQEASERISKESPLTSAAAFGANIATDIALTRGMSGLKAAPLLTAGSAGSRIFTNPAEVAGETALSGVLGAGADKATKWLGGVASRRAASRALPGQQAQVQAQNAAGEFATKQSNIAAQQAFKAQNAAGELANKQANTANMQQYHTELGQIKNQKSALEAVKNQNKQAEQFFKTQRQQHEAQLKKMPEMQRQAQKQYSQQVLQNAETISSKFPKDAKIYSSQIGAKQFADEAAQNAGLLGSPESVKVNRILQSIFPENEVLASKSLAGRYRALENAIQKSTPAVQKVLTDFKAHLAEKLPLILADNVAYQKAMPSLSKKITSDVENAIKSLKIKGNAIGSEAYFMNKAKTNLSNALKEITPENFMEKLKSGEIREKILNGVMKPEDFVVSLEGLFINEGKNKASKIAAPKILPGSVAEKDLQKFLDYFTPRLDSALAKADLKTIATDIDAAKKLGRFEGTFGLAPPVTPPAPPAAPAPTPLPNVNAAPIKPVANVFSPNTNPPVPQTFLPQPEPNLAPASTFAESAGDLLEKKMLGGKGLINNPVTKLAGLKYLLGKGALPVEAGYLAMKGLTSPTGGGEAARITFQRGGIEAINLWAQKYPSYRNGILDDPRDRRSLTREIEDDREIPVEQKAIIQTKINRGKPLS